MWNGYYKLVYDFNDLNYKNSTKLKLAIFLLKYDIYNLRTNRY